MTSQLDAVLAAIDEANARDPKRDLTSSGDERPAALLYGQRMSDVLAHFAAEPSEELQIAIRGQHIERWTRARNAYPEGRTGYLQWRRDAAEFHAHRLAEIMSVNGYNSEACQRVGQLVRKLGIKSDHDTQTLEDVACLVFLKWYFAPFASQHTSDELNVIVSKTARKMSERGRAAALALPLPAHYAELVVAAGA
jgi:Domain of unknown function (DUF4202)